MKLYLFSSYWLWKFLALAEHVNQDCGKVFFEKVGHCVGNTTAVPSLLDVSFNQTTEEACR